MLFNRLIYYALYEHKNISNFMQANPDKYAYLEFFLGMHLYMLLPVIYRI